MNLKSENNITFPQKIEIDAKSSIIEFQDVQNTPAINYTIKQHKTLPDAQEQPKVDTIKLYAKEKVDMMFSKMLKIQQKSRIGKIRVFYKNKKIKNKKISEKS